MNHYIEIYNLYLLPQLRPYVPIAERVKDLTSDFKGKYTLLNRFLFNIGKKMYNTSV